MRFFDFLTARKLLTLEKTFLNFPVIDRQRAVGFISLPDNEQRKKLYDLALSTDPKSWEIIEELFGSDIELLASTFIGNCEDYVHSAYPNIPARILASKSYLEKSFVPEDQIKKDKRYIVVYWGKEETVFQKGIRAGFIEKNTQIPDGRLTPVHVGIIRGDTVVSKFSIKGGLVKHKVQSVPISYGEMYSFHELS